MCEKKRKKIFIKCIFFAEYRGAMNDDADKNEMKAKWDALPPRVQSLAREAHRILGLGDVANQIFDLGEIEKALKEKNEAVDQKDLLSALDFLQQCEFINSREEFYVLRPNFVDFALARPFEDLFMMFDSFEACLDEKLANESKKEWAINKVSQVVTVANDLIRRDEFKDDQDVIQEISDKLEDIQRFLVCLANRGEEGQEENEEEAVNERKRHHAKLCEEAQEIDPDEERRKLLGEEDDDEEEQGPLKKQAVAETDV